MPESNFIEAERFLLAAVKLSETVSNKLWTSIAYDALGQVYDKMNADAKARKYFLAALALRYQTGDKKGISETYYHLSQRFASKRLDSAFFYIKASQRIARQLGAADRLLENYQQFKMLFQQRKQYDSMMYYQSLYDNLKEQQFKQNSLRSIEGINLKIQEEESQQQLIVKNAELKQQTYEVKLFVLITVSLLVTAGVTFWFYVTQKRLGRRLTITNQKISRQRDEIATKNAELNSLNAELNNLNIEKNNLIGIVAHDLKSPLNQIKGLTNLIKMSPSSNGENTRYIELIEGSANRLTAMIGKILDVESIESKGLKLTWEDISLVDTVNSAADRYQVLAKDKKIQIKISASGDSTIRADKSYLTQVIENLLSNAIKFSPVEKNIYLDVTSGDDHAQLEIRDEGPGLTDDDKQKLFKKYQKLSAVPTANESSTGLGLSIVKKFVESMRGEIWCESKHGEGASFYVKFLRQN